MKFLISLFLMMSLCLPVLAERADSYGGGDKPSCEEALISSEDEMAAAKKLAAEFVSFFTFQHPAFAKSLADHRISEEDKRGLFHMSAGFAIRPPQSFFHPSTGGIFEKDEDYSDYAKFVRSKGWRKDAWRPNKLAARWKNEQAVIEKIRFSDKYEVPGLYYANLTDQERREIVSNIIETTEKAWSYFYQTGALSSERNRRNQSMRLALDHGNWSTSPITVWFDHKEIVSQDAKDDLDAFLRRTTTFGFNPKDSEREIGWRAKAFTFEFILNYLPYILEVRDLILRDSLKESKGLQIAYMNRLEIKDDVLSQALGLLAAGQIVPVPNYKLKKEEATLPAPAPMALLPAPAREGSIIDLKKSMEQLQDREDLLVRSREFLGILDRNIEILPPRIELHQILPNFPKREEFVARVAPFQLQLEEMAQVSRSNARALIQFRDLIRTETAILEETLVTYIAELDSSSNEYDRIEAQEAELMLLNIQQAKQVFEIRSNQIATRTSQLNQMQSLIRQYRQNALVDDAAAEKSFEAWFEYLEKLQADASAEKLP